ncbi:MAG: SAM-dependent chlorinase/fluorinase [Verrucomicrobiota bacterium]|nr:SAM-dependent chlorinase/fluorinase [Verrucomicrobiota bacterium]
MSGREKATVRARGGRIEGIVKSYSDVSSGQLLAIVGSAGFLKIAVRDGNAAERLGVRVGTEVLLI